MPLPQKVIEQLGREPPKTPGWSFGIVSFCGGIFLITLFIYVGLSFGYEPYLDSQLASQDNQIKQLNQSVSPDDQSKLINFYSQITNLKTLLKAHPYSSQLLTWLEKNTQANVFYRSFSFSSGNQIALTGNGKTQADVNQQIAIYESSPDVQKTVVTSVGVSEIGGGWDFNLTLIMNPTLFARTGI